MDFITKWMTKDERKMGMGQKKEKKKERNDKDKEISMSRIKIGNGYDVHRLTEGRRLILGGIEIPWEQGLLGHSDADV